MDEEVREREKSISMTELEDEELGQEVSVAEKKARIRELKRTYGPGAKKVLGWIKSLKVDKETARNLYGDFGSLRDYNDPRRIRK